jgi:hypothetical protein
MYTNFGGYWQNSLHGIANYKHTNSQQATRKNICALWFIHTYTNGQSDASTLTDEEIEWTG